MPRRFPFLLAALFLLRAWTPSARAAEPAWEVWEDCRLETAKYFDGDSFRIQHGGRSVVLRLYFVDAPEIDTFYAARLAQQAAYFRTTEADILRGGQTARAFTAQFLSKPFRVITRRQVAPGASQDDRLYAIVERGGRRLDAALVQAGLARTTSEIAEYPTLAAGQKIERALRMQEGKAEQEQRGLWQPSARRAPSKAPVPTVRASADGRINLNTATMAQLTALPGVGPKTAEKIIAARPLKDLAALETISGIGPKTVASLRPLVSF
jgi:DNA uptake protein ComE-like DNA-binding protein